MHEYRGEGSQGDGRQGRRKGTFKHRYPGHQKERQEINQMLVGRDCEITRIDDRARTHNERCARFAKAQGHEGALFFFLHTYNEHAMK